MLDSVRALLKAILYAWKQHITMEFRFMYKIFTKHNFSIKLNTFPITFLYFLLKKRAEIISTPTLQAFTSMLFSLLNQRSFIWSFNNRGRFFILYLHMRE